MSTAHISYYQHTANHRQQLPVQEGVIEADICIIGGGFAGLNTALGLAERGQQGIVVLEAQDPAFGASGRNGGFVFGGFSLGNDSLVKDVGLDNARKLYQGTLDAVELIKHRIEHYGIDCDPVHAGVILANWFKDPTILRHRQSVLREKFGHHLPWIDQPQMRSLLKTDRYHDGLFEPNAFHFHPLNYANGLVMAAQGQGVQVFARSPAISLERSGAQWKIATPSGQVHARQVVLACGGYLAGLVRKVDASVLPIATYVMATEPLGSRLDEAMCTRAAVYDTRFAFDYYRPLPDTRILWGGRVSVLDRSPREVERLLLGDMMKVYPQLEGVRAEFAWSGLMSYARHEMPQIGQVEPGLWVAQAFGGHGVGPTTLAGEVLAGAIGGDDTRWKDFSFYGMPTVGKPVGFVAAQLSYWWAIAKDEFKAWRES